MSISLTENKSAPRGHYTLAKLKTLPARGALTPAPWAGRHPLRIQWHLVVSYPLLSPSIREYSYNGAPSFTQSQRLLRLWNEVVAEGRTFNLTGYIYDRKNILCYISHLDALGSPNMALMTHYFGPLYIRPNQRYLRAEDMINTRMSDVSFWPFVNTPIRSFTRHPFSGKRYRSYRYVPSYVPYGSVTWGYMHLNLPRFLSIEAQELRMVR